MDLIYGSLDSRYGMVADLNHYIDAINSKQFNREDNRADK
jgi:hypothetical protein